MMTTFLLYVLAFFVFAHTPIIPVVRVLSFDVPNKAAIFKCFFVAWVKNLLALIPDLLAPIVVPVALLFTRWEANVLPKVFELWDNDASINGDVRTNDPNDGLGGWNLKTVQLEDTPEARAMCYWAKGHHPRSFYARFVWLGLRNRASRCSQMLGIVQNGEHEAWKGTSWSIDRIGTDYRYFELLPVYKTICIRMHCGYKIPTLPGETKAPPVSIGFSLRRAK